MSLLRRRMMMDTKKDSAKYPLVNGRHEFDSGGYVEVTNGNHVKCATKYADGYINLSNIFENSVSQNSADNINYKETWITFPEQSVCVLEITNIVRSNNVTVGINFRSANSNTSLNFSDGNFTDSEDKIKEVTVLTDTNVGCLFAWIANEAQIEFDVEFTVNGERWI